MHSVLSSYLQELPTCHKTLSLNFIPHIPISFRLLLCIKANSSCNLIHLPHVGSEHAGWVCSQVWWLHLYFTAGRNDWIPQLRHQILEKKILNFSEARCLWILARKLLDAPLNGYTLGQQQQCIPVLRLSLSRKQMEKGVPLFEHP